MNHVFELLMLAALIGSIDTYYFHIYKFRLFSRPESVAEEVTHLVRGASFIAITAIILFAPGVPGARFAVLAILAVDLVNGSVDVLLERKSRASLGGLPSVEYLLHVLATFALGAAAATFMHHSSAAGYEPAQLTSFDWVRGLGTLVIGGATVAAETALFVRAITSRVRQTAPASAHAAECC